MEFEYSDEVLEDISSNESYSVEFDVSGNTYIINFSYSDLSAQNRITESIQEIQAYLTDSDNLTNSVFIRYSLSCTLLICLVFLVFNHKR